MAALARRGSSEEFGLYVRQLRQAKAMTQEQVAERVGVTLAYYNKACERGVLPPPSAEVLDKLAVVLETDRDDLFARAGVVPPEVLEALRGRPDLYALVRASEVLEPDQVRRLIALAKEVAE